MSVLKSCKDVLFLNVSVWLGKCTNNHNNIDVLFTIQVLSVKTYFLLENCYFFQFNGF